VTFVPVVKTPESDKKLIKVSRIRSKEGDVSLATSRRKEGESVVWVLGVFGKGFVVAPAHHRVREEAQQSGGGGKKRF